MAKVNTVKTSDNAEATNILSTLETLSLSDKAKLLAMLKTDATVVQQANAEVEAEVNMLTAKIEDLRNQIVPLNQGIAEATLRIKTLTGKIYVPGSESSRAPRAICNECGQGRHAANDKTRACKTYAASKGVAELREAV